MDRRAFITMVGGSILASPLTANAQGSRTAEAIRLNRWYIDAASGGCRLAPSLPSRLARRARGA